MGEFLCTVFQAREVYDSLGNNHSLSREKFFLIGDAWIAVMEGDSPAGRSYAHVAFKVPESAFDEYAARIKRLGVEIQPGRSRDGAEGRSIYFYDYENHLFEIHTGNLADRLLHYREISGASE
jgi:fosfomycin resistance protein FosX